MGSNPVGDTSFLQFGGPASWLRTLCGLIQATRLALLSPAMQPSESPAAWTAKGARMNWTCPFCGRDQTVTNSKFSERFAAIDIQEHSLGPVGIVSVAIGCANTTCNRLTVIVHVAEGYYTAGVIREKRDSRYLLSKTIIPEGSFQPQPDYIPQAIREDYEEACLIRNLSPKASATLARRCLQGMIRDFAKISRSRLVDEVRDLKKAVLAGEAPRDVSIESVEAIDHVRTIGNIGAHMEREVEHIISVDAGEAQILIEIVECLFRDWYVERHNRQVRFRGVSLVAEAKKLEKTPPAPTVAALPAPDIA